MLKSSITSKGQVTIPKKLRTALGLKQNDVVIFVKRDNEIIIKPVRDILTLRGSVQVKQKQNFSNVREKTRNMTSEKIADE